MTKNKDLARKTLDRIKADQKRWDQTKWSQPRDRNGYPVTYEPESQVCNTTFCFAGHALLESGYKFSVKSFLKNVWSTGFRTKGGHAVEDVEESARRRLGLSIPEANSIFYYTENADGEPVTIEQLEQRVSEVFDL